MKNEDSQMGHTYRIKDDLWEAIEKKAWKLSMEAQKPIKPTAIAEAALEKGIDNLKLEDVKK
jgi:hypothetical protein